MKKQIFSNIARVYAIKEMFKEAIIYDEYVSIYYLLKKIVQNLDRYFIKSYARQIHCHRKLANYDSANSIRRIVNMPLILDGKYL